MYTTIVVGTDGSDSAAIAVRQAAELAKVGGGTLHIVHAYQPMNMGTLAMSAGSGGSTIDVEGVNASIESQAQLVCQHAGAIAQEQSVDCKIHSVPGDPCDALISVAEQVHADLLVVGNRGMTGLKRFMLGSVPNKISHHAPCSVLIADTST
jgi:nucleotide-binding universal stress UspA family protein